MIKKLMILTIISVLSLVIFNQATYAATVLVDEPAVNTGGLWHVDDGNNRVYVYMRYTHGDTVIETGSSINETYPDRDLSQYTKWYGVGEDLNFPNTSLYNDYASIDNPDPSVYDKFVVEIMPHIEATAAEPAIPIRVYESVVNEIEVFLDNHDDIEEITWPSDWSYLTLHVDGEEVLSSRALRQSIIDIYSLDAVPNPNGEDLYFGVRMYWEKTETEDDIVPGAWETLPETSASPLDPFGEWGSVSNIVRSNQNISFDISYEGSTYPVPTFTVAGDLDFIDKANDVLYYTDSETGDRILYFNFGETLESAILAATSISDVSVWKGEALWNLTQNEIKVTDMLTVYNYIPEVDDDGNVFSYFYMPDVPIDNLISVSAVLAYRYWDDGLFNIGDPEPGEIQYKTISAVSGETTSVVPDLEWVERTYKTAYITGAAIIGVGLVAGTVPIYGWGIAAASFFAAGAIIQAADVNEWFAYDVEQIEHVIPTIALTAEINAFISTKSGDDQFTADTDKLYKLHLATLQDHTDVQVLRDLSNVTQVVWETDGEIFVVNEENIDDVWDGPGTEIPPADIGNDDLKMYGYIAAGVVGLYFLSVLKLHKKPLLLFVIIGAVVYVLYEMGLI